MSGGPPRGEGHRIGERRVPRRGGPDPGWGLVAFLFVCCVVVWVVALWQVPPAFGGDPETTTTIEATTTTESSPTTTVPSTTTTIDDTPPPLGEPVDLDDVDSSIQQLTVLVGVVGFFVAVHTVRNFGRG